MNLRTAAIAVLGIAALAGLVFMARNRAGGPAAEDEFPRWATYRNDEYGFELRHPGDWTVAATTTFGSIPMINVYPSGAPGDPPFTHHTNVTQVSVFPRGIPTEGVFSQSREGTAVGLIEPIEQARDFLLEDGTVWSRMVYFRNPPASWQFGFVWAAVRIENLASACRRDGAPVPAEECDPLTGDDVILAGTVNGELADTRDRILSSFRFTSL